MYLILVVCVWIIFGVIFVDWKNWQPCYPTILFFIVLNLLYDFLYYNHTLWAFKAITTNYINHTIISISFFFIIVPIAILIFLQRFPTQRKAKILYILIWSFFFWIIELLFVLKGMFVYDHGWNIWHSGWFDIVMFSMFRLHYKNPLLTICLSLFITIAFIYFFPVPLSSLK